MYSCITCTTHFKLAFGLANCRCFRVQMSSCRRCMRIINSQWRRKRRDSQNVSVIWKGQVVNTRGWTTSNQTSSLNRVSNNLLLLVSVGFCRYFQPLQLNTSQHQWFAIELLQGSRLTFYTSSTSVPYWAPAQVLGTPVESSRDTIHVFMLCVAFSLSHLGQTFVVIRSSLGNTTYQTSHAELIGSHFNGVENSSQFCLPQNLLLLVWLMQDRIWQRITETTPQSDLVQTLTI